MKKILCSFFAILLLISCQKDDSLESTTPTGKITGNVRSQNGLKNIGGAIIFSFDNDNEIIYTHSDANGDFTLELPEGNREIHIQTGNGSNFRTNFSVEVTKNQTQALDNSTTVLQQVANIAYVSGSYDEIEDLISNLGYTATSISFSDLGNYNIVSQYDIIFLNCGSRNNSLNNLNATIDTNLAKFVTNGGSLYSSDWALTYLMGGQNNVSACNVSGGFIPDATLCSINNGLSGYIYNAQVVDTNLSNSIGFSAFDLNYDLPSWQQVISFDSNYWTSLVNNPTNGQSLMLKTNSFYDSSLVGAIVGNDNTDNWVTICHIPPGNQNNPITITINQNALNAHLAHGDSLGSCNGSSSGGTIYFTTFHNHAAGNIGNSESILNYVIMNL